MVDRLHIEPRHRRGPEGLLRKLPEHAKFFHHGTTPARETEEINHAEFQSFVERALVFARR